MRNTSRSRTDAQFKSDPTHLNCPVVVGALCCCVATQI